MTTISTLQQERFAYRPKLPAVYAAHGPVVVVQEGAPTTALANEDAIARAFPKTYGRSVLTFAPGTGPASSPLRVGVILSGGQAPGGHNVIAGIFDGLKAAHPNSELIGFLGGPSGLTDNKYRILDAATIDAYRNTGGFDLIGSGRTKLGKPEQFDQVAKTCRALKLDAVVIIGGDDSNTNAGVLAEYFEANQIPIRVIGCPKTIDGDLKNELIEISFGFDTATKLYADLVGNIARDADSAKKYWHFIKLMGRSASHVTLECALQTHPNVALISEEVVAKQQTLHSLVEYMAGVIRDRAARKCHFGVILVPEGLIEFIPEVKLLIDELNDLLAAHEDAFNAMTTSDDRLQFVSSKLSADSAQVFNRFPETIKLQLLADRDSHGQVQVSRIETEKLLMDLVIDLLREWRAEGKYQGTFKALSHFLGYEGRCSAPSNFDADYCYSLGYTAVALVLAGKTGYMASVRRLCRPPTEWIAGGLPLTMMMHIEHRKGKDVPVIQKCLVDLAGKPFQAFAAARALWAIETDYVYPGSIQYFGPASVTDAVTCTLQLEQT